MAEDRPAGAGYFSCTIVARNYVAQARVLAESFHSRHPSSPFFTLVIDGDEEDRDLEGLGVVLLPTDIGLEAEVVHNMQVIYDVMEYATALKPALLMHLIRTGASTATYFDPDIRVYANMDDVFSKARDAGIFLTPHTLDPIPRDGAALDEQAIMHSGMYNLGFISVGSQSFKFLSWWHERLSIDAVVDLERALFTDQRWIDWVPSLFTPFITRDRGLNAAYWNLHDRRIRQDATGAFWAGDTPLRFFHFSGYDPAKPWLLSKHMGANPRTLLSENSDLQALCDDYGDELVRAGHVEMRKNPYRNAELSNGLRLTPLVRSLYRKILKDGAARSGLPNDPVTAPEEFVEWLLEPTVSAGELTFSRLEMGIWNFRLDLRNAFPDLLGMHAREYRSWLDTDEGASRVYSDLQIAQPPSQQPKNLSSKVSQSHAAVGWSVLGYARAELGVGEAGRRMSQAMALTGLPWEMVGVSVGPQSRQDHSYAGVIAEVPTYDNVLICVNADQTERLVKMLDLQDLPGKKIGYWFWELEAFPDEHRSALDYVDEVWVASEFTRASVASATKKPVKVVPLPVITENRSRTSFSRTQLGIPEDKTVFLVNFDYLSTMERKNPIAAIEAYCEAFADQGKTCLLVKSINGHLRPLERERVRLALRGRSDIILRDGYVSAPEMQGIIELVDCVVSLHRSEGYGLNLVDAMASGTPVIATGYSGNLGFMDDATALMVPHSMTEVGPHAAPYDPSAVWAEPDLEFAARAMRRVVEDRAGIDQMVDNALRQLERFSPARVADLLKESVLPSQLWQELSKAVVR